MSDDGDATLLNFQNYITEQLDQVAQCLQSEYCRLHGYNHGAPRRIFVANPAHVPDRSSGSDQSSSCVQNLKLAPLLETPLADVHFTRCDPQRTRAATEDPPRQRADERRSRPSTDEYPGLTGRCRTPSTPMSVHNPAKIAGPLQMMQAASDRKSSRNSGAPRRQNTPGQGKDSARSSFGMGNSARSSFGVSFRTSSGTGSDKGRPSGLDHCPSLSEIRTVQSITWGMKPSERLSQFVIFLDGWIIHPSCLFYRLWSAFISALVIVNCVLTPLHFAFKDDIGHADVTDTFTDIVFAIDVLLGFKVAFATENELLTSHLSIARHYSSSRRFWIALISAVPMDNLVFLAFPGDRTGTHIGAALGLLRLLRINRLIILFQDLQKNTIFNLVGIVVGKFFLFILLCTHTSGCIFYGLARINGFDEFTWVAKLQRNLPMSHLATRYVHVLFWAVSTFKAGPSHSSIIPTSNSEMILAIVTMMVNICLQTYLVSNMAALLTSSDMRIYAFRKEVTEFNTFFNRHNLPEQMREQLSSFLNFKFATNQELDQAVLSGLPELYRQRVSHVLYDNFVSKCLLFSQCQQLFLFQLHSSFKTTSYMPQQCLADIDEPSMSLQILAEGEVELLFHGSRVDGCQAGESFSAVPFLCNVGHSVRVQTCWFAQVLSLDRISWERATSAHPNDLTQVKVNILEYCQDKVGTFDEAEYHLGKFIYSEFCSIVSENLVQQQELTVTMMCSAAARGDVKELRRLLIGQNPNCSNCDGRTPLHLAAASGALETIHILLEKYAEVDPIDNHGRTPLLEACQSRKEEAASLLFKKNAILGCSRKVRISRDDHPDPHASVNTPFRLFEDDWDKNTISTELCRAAASIDKVWYLKALLRYRADANKGDYDMRTPLHVACAFDNSIAVKVLTHHPTTELSSADRFGQTPLMSAVRQGNEDCATILQESGADHGYCLDVSDKTEPCAVLAAQELGNAAYSNQVDLLHRLVRYCALDVDLLDQDQRTAFMCACSAGHTAAAIFLAEKRADINRVDRFGNSPLSEAQKRNHPEVVGLLEGIQKASKA